MRRFVVVCMSIALLLAALATSACRGGQTAERTAPEGGSATPSSAEVVVPDVVMAVEKHRWTPRFTEDPDATGRMLEAYAEGFLEAAGLEPDVQLQPISVPDSQEPTAGAVVPRGSVVHVRIGFGE